MMSYICIQTMINQTQPKTESTLSH